MVARLQRSIESLHEMGHPDYHEEYYHNLDCSASLEDVELEVFMIIANRSIVPFDFYVSCTNFFR